MAARQGFHNQSVLTWISNAFTLVTVSDARSKATSSTLNAKIFAAIVSIIFAICLVIYMKKSKLGRAIRATAQNARAAKILGVDTEKVYAATFGINAALCGVAGALISITFTIHPYMGLPYTIRSFMIVIVAGLGNLPGVALSVWALAYLRNLQIIF